MDHSQLDKVRRSAAPLQLDAVEAFAAGRLSRREFIQRATILGLSGGAIGMVIAACSGSTASPAASGAAPSAAGSGAAPSAAGSAAASAAASAPAAAGGTIRIAIQRPVKVDPVAMQDLGGYGITAQSFEFLCTL